MGRCCECAFHGFDEAVVVGAAPHGQPGADEAFECASCIARGHGTSAGQSLAYGLWIVLGIRGAYGDGGFGVLAGKLAAVSDVA